jgi:hypothetical protein
MPFIAKDATDVSTAYNKDIGGATLAGALTPGGPAAVRTTPDQLRVAGELYTGNAPTTTTMVTSEDTAPALNAVRETAGKLPYDITRDQAAAEAKAKAEAAAAPFGSDTRAHAAAIVAAYEAKLARNETPLPGEAEQARQAREILARENTLVTPDKSKVQTFNDKTGKWEAGDAGAPAAESSAYADATGQDPTEIRHLDEVSARIHDDPTYKPSTLSYTDYDSMFTNQYLSPKAIQDTGPNKEPVIRWLYRTKPASVLTPAQVQARMQGLPLPPAEPLKLLPPPDPNAAGTPAVNATGSAAAAAGMPPSVVTQVIGPPPKVVMTAEQMRDAKLAPQLLNAFSEILKTDPADLPGPFWQVWANPSNDPSTIQTYIEQMADPAARRYAQALNQFALNLYSLSGAAFPGGEKPQNIRTFVMSQADNLDPQTRANKVKAMANLVNSMHLAAFWNDDARRHAFQQDALKLGIKLSDRDVAPIQDDPYAAPAAGATDPAATAAPTTFSDGKPLTPMPQGLGIDPANWPNFDEQGRADAYQLEKMLKAKGAP